MELTDPLESDKAVLPANEMGSVPVNPTAGRTDRPSAALARGTLVASGAMTALPTADRPMASNATFLKPAGASKTPGVGVRPPWGRKSAQTRSFDHRSAPDALGPCYGALDLGTNNCRLLVARPSRRGFLVVDAFSRIIRLGEGVAATGRLSEVAIERTLDALRVCQDKLQRSRVERARFVATEACRQASNGMDFLDRVRRDIGLDIEILSRGHEARLAVSGCAALLDADSDRALVFDIGGGSSELIWIDIERQAGGLGRASLDTGEVKNSIRAWTSLPVGVVSLAEKFGTRRVTRQVFNAMVQYVLDLLAPFETENRFRDGLDQHRAHLLGTSGTVTTIAGIHLGLKRYDRSRVDGCWMRTADARAVTEKLIDCSYAERLAEPCIGRDRADLVMAGCAIFEAILKTWPCERLRVADRGLREGILTALMSEDGVYRPNRRRPGGVQ